MMLVVLLMFVAGAFAQEEACGINERYNKCGTHCPLTCENYDNPPTTCYDYCKRGCECIRGFVRTPDGICVRPEDCPNRSRIKRQSSSSLFDVTANKMVYKQCGRSGTVFRTKDECSANCNLRRKRQTKSRKVVIDTDVYIYGGCGGRQANGFNTKDECLANCANSFPN